jgi:DNA-3-methyladenine glycosylase II
MKHDRIMRKLIPKYPKAEFLTTRGDPFQTLARAIVGQQISVKAAQSVWERTIALTKNFTAKAVLKLDPTALRAAGLSQRKVEYMQDLATHFENGGLSSAKWDLLDDDTVIAELTAIRGIGRWTAEMFLIFYLMAFLWPISAVNLCHAMRPKRSLPIGRLGKPWPLGTCGAALIRYLSSIENNTSH